MLLAVFVVNEFFNFIEEFHREAVVRGVSKRYIELLKFKYTKLEFVVGEVLQEIPWFLGEIKMWILVAAEIDVFRFSLLHKRLHCQGELEGFELFPEVVAIPVV
jgi:hypothetical protein